MGYYKEQIDKYYKSLIEGGYDAIKKAYEHRKFTNRTFNLHDSYGSCLFVHGKEYPNSRRYVGRKALVGKEDPQGNLISGRGEVDKFFDNFKADSTKTQLVVVAAIFYATILGEKYKVISGAYDELQELSKKVGGTIETLN